MRKSVEVDKEGVGFGNFWASHETITGCVASLIPTHQLQYWEWAQANDAANTKAIDLLKKAQHALNAYQGLLASDKPFEIDDGDLLDEIDYFLKNPNEL